MPKVNNSTTALSSQREREQTSKIVLINNRKLQIFNNDTQRSVSQFSLYSKLVLKTNTTEEVVKLGGAILRDISLYNKTVHRIYTPSNHSGNWKSSFLQNLSLAFSHFSNGSTAPPILKRNTDNHIILPSPKTTVNTSNVKPLANDTRDTRKEKQEYSQPYLYTTTTSSNIEKTYLHAKQHNPGGIEPQRRMKRSPGLTTYDLTAENIENRIMAGIDPSLVDKNKILKIKEVINKYNQLPEKNSHEGMRFLKIQGQLLTSISPAEVVRPDYEKNISPVIEAIKAEYKSHKVRSENFIHAIWVAGAPPDNTATYIKSFLITYPEHTYILWVDDSAYGAAKFSGILKKYSLNYSMSQLRNTIPEDITELRVIMDKIQRISEAQQDSENTVMQELETAYNKISVQAQERFNALFLESVLKMQDTFFNYCLSKGIVDINDDSRVAFLTEVLKRPQHEVAEFIATMEGNKSKVNALISGLQQEFGTDRISLQDVKQLKSLADPQKRYFYLQEMFLRWNYSSASDHLRMYMLKEYGGMYTDTDILPAYSKDVLLAIMFNSGDSRFLEVLNLRRLISEGILNHLKGNEMTTINISSLSHRDNQVLQNILKAIKKIPHEKLFQQVDLSLIRDSFKMFKRYQLWSNDRWNVRGNSNFMLTHKDSRCVDAIIHGQQREYLELQRIRNNINNNQLILNTNQLRGLPDNTLIGGVPAKKYLADGLFSDYRQDSIVPYKVSTLYVSGPDIMMKEMRKYYKGLGPLNEIFLDNGVYLGSETFMGTYKKTPTGKFDWLNPESVGVNDITPDDESTWAVKDMQIKKILFDEIQGDILVNYPKITLTKIEKEKFSDLWDDKSKSILREVYPGLLDDFNSLLTDSTVDANKVLKIDQALDEISSRLTSEMAKQAIYSLQLQLADFISTTSLPLDNHLHLFFDFYRKTDSDILYSLKLFFNNDPEMRATIWYNSSVEATIFIRTMLSFTERNQTYKKLLREIKNNYPPEHIEAIQHYRDLKNKQLVFELSVDEESRLLDATLYLQSHEELYVKIREIEEAISKGHHIANIIEQHADQWGKLLTSNEDRLFYNYVKKDLPQAETLYDKIREKCTSETREKRRALQHELQKRFNERIQFLDIDSVTFPGDLLYKLQHSGYAFSDLSLLFRYSLARREYSGVFSEEVVYPAPSIALIDTIKKYANNERDIPDILPFIFNFFNNEDKLNIPGHHSPPEHLEEPVRLIKDELIKHPLEYPFARLSEQSTSILGVKFATNNGRYDEKVFVSGNGLGNIVTYSINEYLNHLFDIHMDTLHGRISEDGIHSKYEKIGMSYLVTDENMARFMRMKTTTPYLSLTEIHQALTGYKTFAETSMLMLRNYYAGTVDILRRPQFYGHAPVDQMSRSALIRPYDFSGLGILDSPADPTPPIPTLHTIIEQAKYNLLVWDDFYSRHVSLWDTAVRQHQGYNTDYHPQSLIVNKEGRCMGLSLLYLEAGSNAAQYLLLQENLMKASALYQTKHRDGLPLSPHDDNFLRKVETLLESAQRKGNNNLARSALQSLPLSDPDSLAVSLSRHRVSSFLITTESHSLVLQSTMYGWRVTEPNFGHSTFITLPQALTFIRAMVEMPAFRHLYGTGTAQVHFSPDRQVWQMLQLPRTQTSVLVRVSHHTTAEQLTALSETVRVGKVSVTKAFLHEIGATYNKARLSANTHVDSSDLQLKLNGDVLRHYLNTHVVTQEKAQQIRVVLETVGLQPGTQKVKPEQVFTTPSVEIPFHVRLQQQKQHVKLMLLDFVQRLDVQLQQKGLSLGSTVDRLDRFLFPDDNPDVIQMRVTDNTGQHHTVSVEAPELGLTFREGLDSLAEGVNAMNLDAVLSVIGLVQYGRLMAVGEQLSALDHAGAVMDVKNLLDKALGAILRLVGNKIYNPGISGASLEGLLAARLDVIAARVGGTAGRYLSSVAKVLKLPLVDIGINIWAMYTSVRAYTAATSYTERLVAAVDISFVTITTSLSLASIAYPPLALAIVPITLFAHDARNYALHVGQIQERRDQWLAAQRFLDNGVAHIVNAMPDVGVLDLSNNQILGKVLLDMRHTPPRLTGRPSFNSGKDYGSHPNKTDRQVMADRAYNWVCTNNGDAHVPSLWGEHRDVCNAVSVTPDQMARGYANRQWPEKIPGIPPGKYHTILLGYGETLQANTEVIRTGQGDFQEVARAYGEDETPKPLLTVVSQRSHVIAGDAPLTVVIPVADKMLLGTHAHMIDHYKGYQFIMEGGKGGITVQVGGIGRYDITGQPGVRNVLSYQQMPRNFVLELDLSRETAQHPSGVFDGTVMTLRQRGINTVVGTASGYDRITGSAEDNTFYLGAGGGSVHSGGGHNVYIVPGELQARSQLYFSPQSRSHYIHFSGNSTQFGATEIHRPDRREFVILPLSERENSGLVLEGYDDAQLSDFTDRVRIFTKDGLELRWHGEPAELQVAKVDVLAWEKQHTGVSLGEPKAVLAALPSVFSVMDPCMLVWPDYQVELTTQMWSYTLLAPGQQLLLPEALAVSVLGTSGSRYIMHPKGHSTVTLILKGDSEFPEIVDLSRFLLRQPMPEIRLGFHRGSCRITITNQEIDVSQEITLTLFGPASGHIHHSQTLIRLSSSDEKSLAQLYRMVSHEGGEIQLHVIDERVAERIVEVGQHKQVVAYLPDVASVDGDRILCLENSSGMKKIFHGNVLSGVLKGVQSRAAGRVDAADINKLGIQPYSRVYLIFEGNNAALIQGTVTTAPLHIRGEDSGILPAKIWQEFDEIVVWPGEQTPSVELQEFQEWRINNISSEVMHEIMYQHGAVQIHKRDLILTLFRQQTEQKIGVHKLILKDFFNQEQGSTIKRAQVSGSSVAIPANPAPLINPAYQTNFRLTLGNNDVNILYRLSRYARMQVKPSGTLVVDGRHILPQGFPQSKLYMLRFTPDTAKLPRELLWMVLQPQQLYYINPNGDLLLTRLRHFEQAIIIVLEGYRDHWWRYYTSITSTPRLVEYMKETIIFSPEGIQITYNWENGKQELYHYPVPHAGKVYSHNPSAQHAFSRESAYRLWELGQRVTTLDFAQAQDLQVEKMAIVSGKWKITTEMLRYFPGYYHTQVTSWSKGWLQAGDTVSTPPSTRVNIYLTSGNTHFENRGNGYQLYYRMDNIQGVQFSENQLGDTHCSLLPETKFVVTGIDETLHHRRIILITLSPGKSTDPSHYNTPGGEPLF
ncbi:TPA: DUF3491 domain-containing protein [Salmonella enterica]|nr:DUF3491 domain-containing protein [Salmonella enterica]